MLRAVAKTQGAACRLGSRSFCSSVVRRSDDPVPEKTFEKIANLRKWIEQQKQQQMAYARPGARSSAAARQREAAAATAAGPVATTPAAPRSNASRRVRVTGKWEADARLYAAPEVELVQSTVSRSETRLPYVFALEPTLEGVYSRRQAELKVAVEPPPQSEIAELTQKLTPVEVETNLHLEAGAKKTSWAAVLTTRAARPQRARRTQAEVDDAVLNTAAAPKRRTPGKAVKQSSAAAKPPAQQEPRPGDWTCPSCSYHNYGVRTECNRCGAEQPAEAAQAFQANRERTRKAARSAERLKRRAKRISSDAASAEAAEAEDEYSDVVYAASPYVVSEITAESLLQHLPEYGIPPLRSGYVASEAQLDSVQFKEKVDGDYERWTVGGNTPVGHLVSLNATLQPGQKNELLSIINQRIA
ncbi:uncharacterized protein V1510DRAFT_409995 [Dipodascopsis tothii]|uniref:uncharacterized protein n=1 Tax=Dipodascopsis tothii TaxID=44089 RepID=UPI0034CDCC60